MKPNTIFRRMAVLVATMMCALGANAQEAYACYTESNTTLTFYYDDQRSSREGTTYDLNTGSNNPGWTMDGTMSHVKNVIFDPSFASARPTTTRAWFYDMYSLQSITGMQEYLNTSEVTNMSYMFAYNLDLTSFDLSGFNTSKVTNMQGMFIGGYSLTNLNLTRFSTSKVTDMKNMFRDCPKLQRISVGGGWSTASVTSSSDMFYNCTKLKGGQGTTYDANHINAAYAHADGGPSNPGYFTALKTAYACYTPENTTLTFYYDNQHGSRTGTTYILNKVDYRPDWYNDDLMASVTEVVFDPSFASTRPTTTYSWFSDMGMLYSIKGLAYLNTSAVNNMGRMFTNCVQLESLDLSSFDTSMVTDMSNMINGCWSLKDINLLGFDTSKVTDMSSMFYNCINLKTIFVGESWSTAAVIRSTNMFRYCEELVGGQGTTYNANHIDKTYAHIDGGTSNPGYFTEWKEAYACYTPENTTLTFYYDSRRRTRPGTTYDLNTNSDQPGWITDNTNLSLTNVIFDSSFASARPTSTYYWFNGMENLQSIKGIRYLNTSEVTNMTYMFAYCEHLTSLDVKRFNTAKVTSMDNMFYYCINLTTLDLSSFNTINVKDMRNMFMTCRNLQTIYVSDSWSTKYVTMSDKMFRNCSKLVGGQGTTYSSSHVDKTYARIDGGPSNPGYFTEAATGVATNVEVVPAKTTTVKGIYTLDGRKLNELPTKKGIYIIDGRQVVIH